MMGADAIVQTWRKQYAHTIASASSIASNDRPNYWRSNPSLLVTTSNVHHLYLGTGSSIYGALISAIESAEHEVILATCFWTRSRSLDLLGTALRKLSAKAEGAGRTIRVRICFSSSSLLQKLFHTISLDGKTYSPAQWQKTLGLPSPSELRGLDLEVKSVFVLPISIMHSKFIIVDRKQVLLPSCNVSWEDWFEGCIELTGPVVHRFVNFWKDFWASPADRSWERDMSDNEEVPTRQPEDEELIVNVRKLPRCRGIEQRNVQTIFLPSSHHRNPNFTLPWQPFNSPPATPLNSFLLALFAQAESNITIYTPNLTAPPVLSALLAALKRGINVAIITSENLMVLEQLVTAGTTTSRCINKLTKRHTQLVEDAYLASRSHPNSTTTPARLEAGQQPSLQPGRLSVSYFQSINAPISRYRNSIPSSYAEPLQLHLKLTIIDSEIAVFGSGNMDRASWYTSQELCVAVVSTAFVECITSSLDPVLEWRTRSVYDLHRFTS